MSKLLLLVLRVALVCIKVLMDEIRKLGMLLGDSEAGAKLMVLVMHLRNPFVQSLVHGSVCPDSMLPYLSSKFVQCNARS